VGKLYAIVECLFLFQWYKNYKNRPRNARVVVENNVDSFSGQGMVNIYLQVDKLKQLAIEHQLFHPIKLERRV